MICTALNYDDVVVVTSIAAAVSSQPETTTDDDNDELGRRGSSGGSSRGPPGSLKDTRNIYGRKESNIIARRNLALELLRLLLQTICCDGSSRSLLFCCYYYHSCNPLYSHTPMLKLFLDLPHSKGHRTAGV